MLLPSFKLNFVFPVNVFAPGLQASSGQSPVPFLPFFQVIMRSPSFLELRSCHSSELGSVRLLCNCPLPLGSARRWCGRPLLPSSIRWSCSFVRWRCGCPFSPSSARQRCSRPLLLSSAGPSCTFARWPCGCPLSRRSSKRPRNFARQ
jgi:hypothetical protein